MAKFKVGDKVTDGNSVFQITKVNPDDYDWKLVKGDGKDASGKSISAGGMISWADQKMRKAANAVTSKNPVVANALNSVKATNAVLDVNGKQLNKGDKVKIAAGNLPDAKKGESGVVTWVWTDGSNGVDVRLASGKTCSYKGTAFAKNAVSANAVDPLDALNSAETKMREAIGELGKVTDPDLRPLASRIATKLKAVQGELRRELAV